MIDEVYSWKLAMNIAAALGAVRYSAELLDGIIRITLYLPQGKCIDVNYIDDFVRITSDCYDGVVNIFLYIQGDDPSQP